jgi:hypothetical protein
MVSASSSRILSPAEVQTLVSGVNRTGIEIIFHVFHPITIAAAA